MPLLCLPTPSLLCLAEPFSLGACSGPKRPSQKQSVVYRSLVGAGATGSLHGYPMLYALHMEHHRPETLTEPKISEKVPVGRQLFSGPSE